MEDKVLLDPQELADRVKNDDVITIDTRDPDSFAAFSDPADCEGKGSQPDVMAETEFSIMQVQRALASLSMEHRTALLMHDAEGYKLEEIQSITGIPIGTLKSRLHRARARLRELLDVDGTF